MEQIVNSIEIDKVLIVCNSDYMVKNNERKGCVGVENTRISSEVYNAVKQEKFIPIIFERDDNGQEIVSTFIKSKIYIDLSSKVILKMVMKTY